jgi:hypothetical protein
MSCRFLGHRHPGLPDPADIGPHIYLTDLELMRFPGQPFYRIGRAKGLQSCGASPLVQGGSGIGHRNLRLLLLNGRKDLGKCGGVNKYLASIGKSSGCGGWRDNRRCIGGTSLVTSNGSSDPLGLGSGPFVGGAVHTE